MSWVLVLFAFALVALLAGVYITRKQETSGDKVSYQYDDPLLNDVFAAENAQDKLDTVEQQHQNTDNFNIGNVYDSHGNLIFGHQDETEDLDRPEVDDLA